MMLQLPKKHRITAEDKLFVQQHKKDAQKSKDIKYLNN